MNQHEFDLVVRGGDILDGTGASPYCGDVAIRDGRIAAIGRVDGSGAEEIDARGVIVTPGFVDIHTHYDGHATWAQRLQPSSQHGVTTVVTGNCGVGFAPCKPDDRLRLVHLMEGVEDIPEVVMTAGLPWNWVSFAEYLDALDERRFDMDVATQVPHAPLRVFVMGDRAMTREPATNEDIRRMREMVRDAVRAGAIGFSTSRSLNHKAVDGTVTPSYAAAADELAGIACGVAEAGTGVLQFISDFEDVEEEFEIARRMVRESGRPLSMSLMQLHHAPSRWRAILDRIEDANERGLKIRGQVAGRPIGLVQGFRFARNPFMGTPAFQEIAGLPDVERIAALRDPARRAHILAQFPGDMPPEALALLCDFSRMYEMDELVEYEPTADRSIAARAVAVGAEPATFAYDLLIADDGRGLLYMPGLNFADNDTAAMETMLASEHTVLGLGDGGAHVGLVCDASLPTYMLRRWSSAGQGKMPVEKVVRALTSETAETVGLNDRGRIAVGLRADLNVIDMSRLALHKPELVRDLPNGAGRLGQSATGYVATIVAGEVTYREGVPTGALPGRLVRGARAAS